MQSATPAPVKPPAQAQGPAYRADIDGLRAVAVMAVVLHHLWPTYLTGGYVGVDVFFVISGYLITQIMAADMAQGRFSLARFYERRARRIFPALFAVLAATWLAGYALLLPSDYTASLRAGLATLLFSANLLFWRESTGYFDATESMGNPLLHMWSLGVEEQFYVVFPWLLMLLLAWSQRRGGRVMARAGRWLLWIALLNLAAAAWVARSNSMAAFYLAPLRGWELLAGAVLAMGVVPASTSRWWREVVSLAGLAAVLAASVLYTGTTPFPGLTAVLPVLGAAAVIWAGTGHTDTSGSTWVTRALSVRAMTALGLISYSLYLWHWPVLVLARHSQDLMPNPAWDVPVLLACLALAAASYRWIEQPWRRKPRLAFGAQPARGRLVLLGAAALGLAGCHALGVARQGFEQRVGPAVLALDKARQASHPYKNCDGRIGGAGCVLGALDTQPDILLWGDSHMLAWSPALSPLLSQAGRSAVLAVHFACGPLLGVYNAAKRSCQPASEAVRAYLQSHPHIKTVVVAAYWRDYFRPTGYVRADAQDGPPLRGSDAAALGLRNSLAWLQATVPHVVLIGPAPVYELSVPQLLALRLQHGRPEPPFLLADQQRKHADFSTAVAALPRTSGWRYVDPLPWFCDDGHCRVQQGGVPLYRDEQHLSAAGALSVAPALGRALGFGAPADAPADTPVEACQNKPSCMTRVAMPALLHR